MRAIAADPPPRWLSTADAAAYLGVVPRTVYGLVNRGELAAFKIGRVMRIRADDVADYLARHRVQPGDLDHLLGRDDTENDDRPEAN